MLSWPPYLKQYSSTSPSNTVISSILKTKLIPRFEGKFMTCALMPNSLAIPKGPVVWYNSLEENVLVLRE